MQIAWIQDKDAPCLARVFTQAVMAIDPSLYSQAQKHAWAKEGDSADFWCSYAQKHSILGAWNEHQHLLGFLSYQPAFCYLDTLFVAPEAQGQGVTTRLWHEILNHYYPKRQPRLFTHASKVSKPIFEHFGFAVLQTRQVKRKSVYLTQYWMMRPSHR